MGVDAGDYYDNDGDLDLLVTNYQLEHNALYRNDGSYYAEISFAAGLGKVSLNYLGFGTGFLDYDNDGGSISSSPTDTCTTTSRSTTRRSTTRWSPTGRRPSCCATSAAVSGMFPLRSGMPSQSPTQAAGQPLRTTTPTGTRTSPCSMPDGGQVILRNEGGNAAHWLDVELEGRTNRDAVGAKLWVGEAGARQFREIHGGVGNQSSSPYRAHFGFGSLEDPGPLVVRWPSGVEQVIAEPPLDGTVRLVEPAP